MFMLLFNILILFNLTQKFEQKCVKFSINFLIMHGKNDFVQVSKNLARYRSENNFVGPLK